MVLSTFDFTPGFAAVVVTLFGGVVDIWLLTWLCNYVCHALQWWCLRGASHLALQQWLSHSTLGFALGLAAVVVTLFSGVVCIWPLTSHGFAAVADQHLTFIGGSSCE